MKKKEELEKNEKAGFHSEDTAYDQALKRMEKRDTRMDCQENSSDVKAVENTEEIFLQRQAVIAQAIESLSVTLEPYQNLFKINSGTVTEIISAANTIVPECAVDSLSNSLGIAAQAVSQSCRNIDFIDSGLLNILDVATKTPEILGLQTQLENSGSLIGGGLTAVADYVSNLTSQWHSSFALTDIVERSIAAQNLAVIRILPDYNRLDLPRGSKSVLKSLTKIAAEKLIQTEDIFFDPKEKDFYHKNSPECKLTADQITVVESSQDLFADISLDELVSFESQLYDDVTFAMEHPVGKKIFEIIRGWKKFISFDADTYYHARKIEAGRAPFLDQEMLKAPVNISSHGRYNAIGKSCYYIAETKEGALKEITKHSGGKKVTIQVVGLKPVKRAKIIDLSGEIKGTNRFIEHLRFTVENEDGKIVKNYLLPNFVASCCKKIGIEGIKYKSTGYNCCVLWRDDYFEFVEGSREIISEETGTIKNK